MEHGREHEHESQSNALATLNQIPWMPIITVLGWIVFGATFYVTTNRTLQDNAKSIDRIFATREKLMDTYTSQLKAVTDSISNQNQTIQVRIVEANNRFANVEENVRRQEQRIDKIVQLLDSMYAKQEEILRKLDGRR